MTTAPLDETATTQYITETFDGVDVLVAAGYSFFFYDPGQKLPAERRFPFATLAASDNEYDTVSNLDRPSVFRLNIGVSKETYRELFGPQPPAAGASGIVETGHDFTTLDQILPHPVYAPQSWICVLSPSAATFDKVRLLLDEAYALAVRKYGKLRTLEDS
ncbi:MAG: DUF6194 family protein [Planctomycetota bacterium]